MYLFFGIFFLVLLIFFCINYCRRKAIIKKVCCMCMDEKCCLLNDLIKPFGYSYIIPQDIFSTRINAWQREFGYCTAYDRAAAGFNMVIDCMPVYFNYQGRTWLIEFWKGQYGINTGCEVGIYYADGIIDENQYEHTLFNSADDEHMQRISIKLYRKGHRIAQLSERHWWLTAFSLGRFSKPSELSVDIRIIFENQEMAKAFAEGLVKAGSDNDEIYLSGATVDVHFITGDSKRGILQRILISLAQLSNRFWCNVYLHVTRPFQASIDRVLYLYFYLPFAFRRMFRPKKYHKKKRGGR